MDPSQRRIVSYASISGEEHRCQAEARRTEYVVSGNTLYQEGAVIACYNVTFSPFAHARSSLIHWGTTSIPLDPRGNPDQIVVQISGVCRLIISREQSVQLPPTEPIRINPSLHRGPQELIPPQQARPPPCQIVVGPPRSLQGRPTRAPPPSPVPAPAAAPEPSVCQRSQAQAQKRPIRESVVTRGRQEREAKKKPVPTQGASTSARKQPGEVECEIIPQDLLEISLDPVNRSAEDAADGDQVFGDESDPLEVPLPGAEDIESDFNF